ncbi:MAG: PKD domain-containing protein, partial [Candidatus Omnitrophota bacterium]
FFGNLTSLSLADPSRIVEQGKAKLFRVDANGDYIGSISTAHALFEAALSQDADHPSANFWYGLTRIAMLAQGDEAIEILTAFGFTNEDGSAVTPGSLDSIKWNMRSPIKGQIPQDAPDADYIQWQLEEVLLKEIQAALNENFSKIDASFRDYVNINDGRGPYEIDQGELCAVKAALNLASFALQVVCAYDMAAVDVDDALNNLSIAEILSTYPELLTPLPKAAEMLPSAKVSLKACADGVLEGIESVKNEHDNQFNDWLLIDDGDPTAELALKIATCISRGLSNQYTEIVIPIIKGEIEFNMIKIAVLGKLFDVDAPIILRDLLPQCDENNCVVPGTFPDPTMAGSLINMDQADLNYILGIGPLLLPIGKQDGVEGEPFSIEKIVGIGPDGDNLILKAHNLPAGSEFEKKASSAGYVEYSLNCPEEYVKEGAYVATFVANNGRGGKDFEKVKLTIAPPPNRPPILRPIGNKLRALQNKKAPWLKSDGPLIIHQVVATDEDGGNVTIKALGLPSGANFIKKASHAGYAQYQFSWAEKFFKKGVHVVTFVAEDGKGAKDTEKVQITITAPRDLPPVFYHQNDSHFTYSIEDTQRFGIFLSHYGGASMAIGEIVIDPEKKYANIIPGNVPRGMQIKIKNYSNGYYSEPGIVYPEIYWPAKFITEGAHVITLSATDGVNVVSKKLTIEVLKKKDLPKNHPPVIGENTQAIDESGAFLLSPAGFKLNTISGFEGDRLVAPRNKRVPIPGGTRTYTYSIYASDYDGKGVTLKAHNLPRGMKFRRIGENKNPKYSTASYKFDWPAKYVKAGTYVVTLVARDPQGLTDTQVITFNISKRGQTPPTISTAGDRKEGTAGSPFSIPKIIAHDNDNQVLTTTATGLPPGANFYETAAKPGRAEYALDWPAQHVRTGTYLVTFTTSSHGEQASKTVEIVITEEDNN